MNSTDPLVIGRQTSAAARILVIDEQPLVSSALAYTLRDMGFDAHSVRADLAAVKEAARAHRPGLVLLDLDCGSMPDRRPLDSVDLIGPLSVQGWTVMVLTGTASRDRLAEAIAHGAVAWISKGATYAELVHAAVEITQGRGVPLRTPELTIPLHDHRDDERPAWGRWVPRFGPTERFAHWWTVAMVATALLTGIVMGDDGGAGPIVWVHAGSVAVLGVGIAAALAFGDRRALIRSTRRLFGLDRRDTRWLRDRLRHPAARGQQPAWGMFNPGQKLLAWALSVSVALVVVTGIVAWFAQTGEGSLHGGAVVLTTLLLGAHLFMAIVNPATRPAMAGMAFGRVRRSWAAEHHRAWLDDLEHSTQGPR